MRDPFGRKISYLRISVTDRCNLRCRYCMPEEGVELVPTRDILSFEEIAHVTQAAVQMGITKIRLTGGEPLVRRDLTTLVAMLAAMPGVRDLAMSTNGILLAQHAHALAAAGLHRVNVSLDAISPQRYAYITRGGDVNRVLAGIAAARDAGLEPVKLNCVVTASPDEPDARAVAHFAAREDLEVRFIERMDPARGTFAVVHGGAGGDCARCNRLRLSSDGIIRPCLLSDLGFSVRRLGPVEALRRAVRDKPAAGGPCAHNRIRALGG